MTTQTHFTESGSSPPTLDAQLVRAEQSPPAGTSEAHSAPPPAGDYLTPRQVADLLQIDEKTVGRCTRARIRPRAVATGSPGAPGCLCSALRMSA